MASRDDEATVRIAAAEAAMAAADALVRGNEDRQFQAELARAQMESALAVAALLKVAGRHPDIEG